MGSLYFVSLPPTELDTFEAPEPEPAGDDNYEALEKLRQIHREQLHRHLDRIPPVEADALELLLRGCTQDDIAIVLTPDGELSYTQAAVSYFIRKGTQRLAYLVWLDSLELTAETIRDIAFRLGCTPLHADVAAAVWEAQSYFGAADLLGNLNGIQVRQRFWVFANRALGCDSAEVAAVKFWLRGLHPGKLRKQRSGPRKLRLAGPRDSHA